MILSFSKTWPWDDSPTNFVEKIEDGRKIHTVRKDKNERWRKGMDIHFATGMRTPQYDNFKMGECTGVQTIRIQYLVAPFWGYKPFVTIDDHWLTFEEAKAFAKSDGFDSWEQFKKWFDEDFRGRLIHWTDKRY